MNSLPDASTLELATRLGVSARVARVVSTRQLSTSVAEVVVEVDPELAGVAGNDIMVRVRDAAGKFIRRRYSVRAADHDAGTVTLWVTTDHDGPGCAWARSAQAGDLVDVIGPRGKIPLDPDADWHVFLGDASGLGAFYRMAQSIEAPGRAIFIVEIDHDDDALTASFDEGVGVTGIFVDRRGRAKNDPAGLLSGLAAFEFPPDQGHAYLFGEFSTIRAVRSALLDRGLEDDHISSKAFWRAGRTNAEHGEPDKSEN
ncbi:MAG: siderophore-interacting protein [Acidimicrobiales bacterium]